MGATDDELAAVDPSDWRMYAVIFYKDLGRSKYTNGALFELK